MSTANDLSKISQIFNRLNVLPAVLEFVAPAINGGGTSEVSGQPS
jgi:hypothetical protein